MPSETISPKAPATSSGEEEGRAEFACHDYALPYHDGYGEGKDGVYCRLHFTKLLYDGGSPKYGISYHSFLVLLEYAPAFISLAFKKTHESFYEFSH